MNLCFLYPRGGGERGLSWQKQGRVGGKKRALEDLQACLCHLFSLGISSPSLTALTAFSAGAVPVGALCNTHPHMMRAVTLQVTCESSGDLCVCNLTSLSIQHLKFICTLK